VMLPVQACGYAAEKLKRLRGAGNIAARRFRDGLSRVSYFQRRELANALAKNRRRANQNAPSVGRLGPRPSFLRRFCRRYRALGLRVASDADLGNRLARGGI